MRAKFLLERLLSHKPNKILDVGCGVTTPHLQMMLSNNATVTCIDNIGGSQQIRKALFPDIAHLNLQSEQFDGIWASHVLEHSLEPHRFLKTCLDLLSPNGHIAIAVPPLKHEIVGGHVTLWNAGLLCYNLVLAGFNCRYASIKKQDYDIGIIVQKQSIPCLPKLNYDAGDIDLLAQYFPKNLNIKEGFNGDISEHNW